MARFSDCVSPLGAKRLLETDEGEIAPGGIRKWIASLWYDHVHDITTDIECINVLTHYTGTFKRVSSAKRKTLDRVGNGVGDLTLVPQDFLSENETILLYRICAVFGF